VNLAGELKLQYRRNWQLTPLQRPLAIELSRPEHLSRLLQGKPPASGQQMIALLFSICRWAQAITSARALEYCLGIKVSARLEQQRNALVWLEVLQEHLWLLLVRLPQALDLPAQQERLAQISPCLQATSKRWHEQGRLAQISSVAASKSTQPAALIRIDSALQQPAANLLLQLPVEALVAAITELDWRSSYRLQAALADLQPVVQDGFMLHAVETGPVVRQQHQESVAAALAAGQTLLPRLQAVIAETRQLLQWLVDGRAETPLTELMPDGTCSVPGHMHQEQMAVARTETARGSLLHEVALTPDRQRIQHYHIQAPTDCNFHVRGVLQKLVVGMQPKSDPSKQQLKVLVQLMNPCVGWELQYHA